MKVRAEGYPERLAWRRFLGALGGLSLAFFLALYATGVREQGRYGTAAVAAALSLLLAGGVAATVVPYLARRSALSRWMVKIQYEFTREGLVYLILVAAVTVAALNTGNNLLFIILACLLAGIVASGILSRIILFDIDLELSLPERVFAQRPVLAWLSLKNTKRLFPSYSITVSTPVPKKSPQESKAGVTQADQAPRAENQRRPILDQPVYFPFIPRRASVNKRVEILFPRRGRYRQEGFRFSTRFPFGLLRKSRLTHASQEVIVLPDVRSTEQVDAVLPLVAGEMESFSKGRGHDLHAIRDYQQTDTTRHIDWKATARAQQLKVREFTREDERRVVLVFDARLARADPVSLIRFEKAVTLAASLAWRFDENSVELEFVTQSVATRLASAAEAVYPILETLAVVDPLAPGAPGANEDLLAAVSREGGGFNLIITSQPRHSIPPSLWGCSYIVFMDSLG